MQLNIMNARTIARITQDKDRWPLASDRFCTDMDISEVNKPLGMRFSIDTAFVEVSAVPDPGSQQSVARFGLTPMKWINSEQGKKLHLRGINARVVQSGTISTNLSINKI